MKSAAQRADALLLIAAVIWGSGFVAQRIGMDFVGPMTFTAARMAIASLVLLPMLILRHPGKKRIHSTQNIPSTRFVLVGGLLAGTVLFIGLGLQQTGLVYTTAGKAGFITGLYVVFVPFIGLFLRHRIGVATWIGVAFATAGLYFLSVTSTWDMNRGDSLVLAGAVVWAGHVQVVGWLSPKIDSLQLAVTQFAVASILATIAALLAEQITWEAVYAARWAILYGGIFPVAVAFTLQIMAQRDAPPTHAAILLSLEAVFAALIGWLILNETLNMRELLGCGLLLAGVLASQYRRSPTVSRQE